MRNIDDGERKRKKITVEIVATNVVASRSPERRPTATPTARAKSVGKIAPRLFVERKSVEKIEGQLFFPKKVAQNIDVQLFSREIIV